MIKKIIFIALIILKQINSCCTDDSDIHLSNTIEKKLTESNFYSSWEKKINDEETIKRFANEIIKINDFRTSFLVKTEFYAQVFIRHYLYNLKKSKKKDHLKIIKKTINYVRDLLILSASEGI